MNLFNKCKDLFNRHRQIISYIFFGGLTTVVNYGVFKLTFNVLGLSTVSSNSLAWVFAVAFAFFTNKFFVFNSKSVEFKRFAKEFVSFVTFRLASGVADTVLMVVFIDYLHYNEDLSKLGINVIVLVLNFIASKLFIFKKKA